MSEDALLRNGPERAVFYRPLKGMTRYLQAEGKLYEARYNKRAHGEPIGDAGLSPDLQPVDEEAFIEALDLVYDRLAGMTHEDAKAAIRAQAGHFDILQDFLNWTAKLSLRDASPEMCRRLVEARSRVQYELGRLRIVYIAAQGGWPGYWTVLGERIVLPTCPDFPPEEIE